MTSKEAYETTVEDTGTKRRADVPRSWILEIVSCTLALIALAATIATVGVYNGRTLPNWPHPITINSMISIFTAIFKASLIMPIAEGISQLKWYWFNEPQPLIDLDRFDTASRGPWGSLLLLFHPRKHYLASLGAFITIAALAVDPFSQQVLQYYDCLQAVPDSIARIPKTNRYSVTGMHTGALSASLDGPAQVAIYMGLLNPPANSSESISVDCPTGNCTFPADNGATFSTLGMCHSCIDISSTVSANTTSIPHNYTLPSGAWVGRELLASTALADDYGDSVFAFETMMLNYPESCAHDSAAKSTSSSCTPDDPFAVRCSLQPCLQTYAANVSQSIYTETLISSEPLPYVIDNGYYWILATNTTLSPDGVNRSCNASTTPTPGNPIGLTANGTIDTADAVLFYPQSCVYIFNFTAAISLREFLASTLADTSLSFYAVPTAIVGELWLQSLFQNGSATLDSVDAFMTGLTTSMTANIRVRGETGESGYAAGTPLVEKTCMRVRWGWFGLPAGLWVLAVAFVAVLALRSGAGQGWKSSVLVPLFVGLERRETQTVASGEEMRGAARGMRVQLLRSGEGAGLRFVDVAEEKEGERQRSGERLLVGERERSVSPPA